MTRIQRPNVIIFLTDQQRWDTSAFFGNPLDLTPHFDAAAAKGTHLTMAFTPQPLCGPARSCLQTGRYPTLTHTWKNGLPLPDNEKTLAHCFSQAGYQTAYIGKWHLAGKLHGSVPESLRGGYQYWLAANIPEFVTRHYQTVLFDNDNNPVDLPGYRSDAIVDAAIRYISRIAKQPFLLIISTVEPHMQNQTDDFPPPDGYRQKYTGKWMPADLAALKGSAHQHLGGYWGMVKRVDEGFGRLLDALKSLRIHEDTIVAYTSDHGCHFKTRNSEYKRSCHDSSCRIPMAVSGPHFTSGGKINCPFSLIDLPPTLLDAIGLPIPQTMQGSSIMPVLRKQSDDYPREIYIQISESQIGRAIRTERWTYCVSADSRNGYDQPGSEVYCEQFLYDNQSDSHQLRNLMGIEGYADIKAELRERLIKRMVQAGEKIPVLTSIRGKPTDFIRHG